MFANLQIARINPAAFLGVQGMLRRGLNGFAVNGQVGDDGKSCPACLGSIPSPTKIPLSGGIMNI
ncbi:MAG: hypothetical protein ABI690_09005 [Chloroflexota bacterium]